MIKVAVPKQHAKTIQDVIPDILKNQNIIQDFEMKIEKRSGRYIVFDYKGEKNYVCISADKVAARNSFIAQYVATAYREFLEDTTERKVFKVYIHMKCKFTEVSSPYHMFINRVLKTLGVDIINESSFYSNITTPFLNENEFYKARLSIREKNSGNYSSYFISKGEMCFFYGKVFGANGKESFLLCMTLTKLSKKEILFFQVEDNNKKKATKKDVEMLKLHNVKIHKDITTFPVTDLEKTDEIRKSAKFHYNLLSKYGAKKCYLCTCDIETAIIGAHIHRVTDIKNSSLDIGDKYKEAIDPDNGMWLCRNHDIFFETGLIYFKGKKLCISSLLNEAQGTFIKEMTRKFNIEDVYYNEGMRKYLEYHRERTQMFSNYKDQ